MQWQKIDSGKYQNHKYYIFKSCYKTKEWWYLYSRSNNNIAQYDVYCGMYKTLKAAQVAAEAFETCDREAYNKKTGLFNNKEIKMLNVDIEGA
jgi:hypothetical protein